MKVPPVVRVDHPTPGVRNLIRAHHDAMRALTPHESCHVMDETALFDSGAHVFAIEEDGESLGMAAIKLLDATHGELKSMHTKMEARGRGIAHALLLHSLNHAREVGLTKLSLETGSDDAFAPARRLYERHGFAYCAPFGGYTHDPLSVFMTRLL